VKRNKTLIVGIVCGIACAACVLAYTQGVRGEVDQARAEALARYGGEQVEVCVAKRDIAAGEVVEASAVETKLWVSDLLPQGAVRSSSDVVGQKASALVLAGEVLTDRRFSSGSSKIDVPAGMCAISVPAKDVQAVGGAISAGDAVDVYATGDSSTRSLARSVQVLATSAGSTESSGSQKVSWVTLAVRADQVEELVAASQKTELYLVLPGADSK
jgi:pilus assembly protein CpaB